MNESETLQSESASEWIKAHRGDLIQKFVKDSEHKSDNHPVSFFMAGSPGAGKTEISKRLMARFDQKPLRVDADEIRAYCPGYTGENAHIFQKAATKGVHILYDYALHKNINIILDGTFAYSGSLDNIQRSLDHNRKVEIYFIYQDPAQAWGFTKKREAIEHRKVSKEIFIEAFIKSQANVNRAKAQFGKSIVLNLIVKDFENNLEQYQANINNIDHYLKKVYYREELNALII
ncbi:MAG: zeta toxin family protein [Patescibacteria group bacterium]|jgi:hypothetical protein